MVLVITMFAKFFLPLSIIQKGCFSHAAAVAFASDGHGEVAFLAMVVHHSWRCFNGFRQRPSLVENPRLAKVWQPIIVASIIINNCVHHPKEGDEEAFQQWARHALKNAKHLITKLE